MHIRLHQIACQAGLVASLSISATANPLAEAGVTPYITKGVFHLPAGTNNPQARTYFDIAKHWMNNRTVVPAFLTGMDNSEENAVRCKTLFELFKEPKSANAVADFTIPNPITASSDSEQVFSQIQPRFPNIPLNRMYNFGSKYEFPSPVLKHVDCEGPCPNVETAADQSALYHLQDWDGPGRDGWLIYNEIDCEGSEDRSWCPGGKYEARGYWAFLGGGWTKFSQFFSFRQPQNRLEVTSSREILTASTKQGFPEFGASFPVMMNGDIYIFRAETSPIRNKFTSMRVRNRVNPDARDFHVTAETVLSIARLERGASTFETKCRYSFYVTNKD